NTTANLGWTSLFDNSDLIMVRRRGQHLSRQPLPKLPCLSSGSTFSSEGFNKHQTSLQGGSSRDVSNLEPSGTEAGTFPPSHRGSCEILAELDAYSVAFQKSTL
ncbi:hypothetical protein AVEN_143507-1, partial [Araneus ventricosus]